MLKYSISKRNKNIQPRRLFPVYGSRVFRSPKKESTLISPTMTELTGPIFNKKLIGELDNDLTKNFSKNGNKAIGQ